MKKDSIVQFVCFETSMDTEEFILQWEQYNKEVGNDQEVTLQQEAEKKESSGMFPNTDAREEIFSFSLRKEDDLLISLKLK